jgi:hypothetical protein
MVIRINCRNDRGFRAPSYCAETANARCEAWDRVACGVETALERSRPRRSCESRFKGHFYRQEF